MLEVQKTKAEEAHSIHCGIFTSSGVHDCAGISRFQELQHAPVYKSREQQTHGIQNPPIVNRLIASGGFVTPGSESAWFRDRFVNPKVEQEIANQRCAAVDALHGHGRDSSHGHDNESFASSVHKAKRGISSLALASAVVRTYDELAEAVSRLTSKFPQKEGRVTQPRTDTRIHIHRRPV
jgi:hypothetical protein